MNNKIYPLLDFVGNVSRASDFQIGSKNICEKITSLFPEVGECGRDVNVDFDSGEKSWVINIKNNKRSLKTYVDKNDVNKCLIGGNCIGVGVAVSQLKDNIKSKNSDKIVNQDIYPRLDLVGKVTDNFGEGVGSYEKIYNT